MKKQRIRIIQYVQSLVEPNILVAYTANGGRLELRRCVIREKRNSKGLLYTTGKNLFFSLTCRGLRQVDVDFSPSHRTPGMACFNGVRGNLYPKMRHYGNQECHIIVCTTFHGPRPVINGISCVCDHKNGDVRNCSADNVEWVTPRENVWRAKHVLQVLRAKKFDLTACNGADMDKWFAIFRALEMADRKPKELSAEELKALFNKFELVDPQARMEYEMTHHMEC